MNENGIEEERFFSCPRCGNEVNIKARYCMKCGYLNPSHPDNAQYKKFITGGKESYHVGEDGAQSIDPVNVNEANANVVSTMFGSNMGGYNLCFFLNLFCYVVLIVLAVVFFYYSSYGDINTLLTSELSYVLIAISLLGIYHYSLQLVYMKMNRHWWASFIPIVNMYALSDAIYGNKWLNLLIFVPIIGEIYYIILLFKMGKEFRTSGLLTVFFPFIMFPVLGYGGSSFRRVLYVSGKDSLEKEYRKKKSFLILAVTVMIISAVMVVYSNVVDINRGMDRISSYYLYFASQRVIRRTKLKVENKVYTCDTYGSTIYFHFDDLEDYFSIPFYVYRDPIEAYVRVDITEEGEGIFDVYNYSISMTDRRYGYAETPIDELKIESVEKYPELDKTYLSGNQCYFTRNG